MAIIILVRPQMGENIGAAARVMLNFGLHELRLVSPRDGWPNERAQVMAAGAGAVIEGATIYDTLKDALYDCNFAFAATARLRDMDIAYYNPRDAVEIAQNKGRVAFVFGAENNGLSNDEVAHCHALLNIPTSDYASLNLAQSVGLVAYEWFIKVSDSPHPNPLSNGEGDSLCSKIKEGRGNLVLANHLEIMGLQQVICNKLAADNYFNNEQMRPAIEQKLLQMLLRFDLRLKEVHFLRGLFKNN